MNIFGSSSHGLALSCRLLALAVALSCPALAYTANVTRPTVAFAYLEGNGSGYAETVDEACRKAYQVDYQVRIANFHREQDTSSSCPPARGSGVRGPSRFIEIGKASHAGARANESGQILCQIHRTYRWERRAVADCGGNRHQDQDIPIEIGGYVWMVKVCPKGASLEGDWCVDRRPVLRNQDGPACGNPVAVSTGCKQESMILATLHVDAPVRAVSLQYANLLGRNDLGGRSVGESSWFLDPVDRRLVFNDPDRPSQIIAARGLGAYEVFRRSEGSENWSSDNPGMALRVLPDGWLLIDYDQQHMAHHDSRGRLIALHAFSGSKVQISHAADGGKVTRLTWPGGRQLELQHGSAGIETLTQPDGRRVTLGYTTPDGVPDLLATPILSSIRYQDEHSRQFHWQVADEVVKSLQTLHAPAVRWEQEASTTPSRWDGTTTGSGLSRIREQLRSGRSVYQLAESRDETGEVFARFTYDDQGRVRTSEHAGGVQRHRFTYERRNNTSTTMTNPLGGETQFSFWPAGTRNMSHTIRQKIPETGLPIVESRSHDASGLVASTSIYWNNQAAWQWVCQSLDATTGRANFMLAGTGWPSPCLPVQTSHDRRKYTFHWTNRLRLEAARAGPGLITTRVHHGEPDPTDGNRILRCAPAEAKLPDGSPIAVLCKRVEQATLDIRGHEGFSATPVGPARVWQWVYDAQGRVLQEDGPRTDVADVTQWQYRAETDTATPPRWHRGDLWKVRNAAGHETIFQRFDAMGQLLEMQLPNGSTWQFGYTPRQWLARIEVSSGGLTEQTTFSYWPTGQLQRLTLADGSFLHHEYDAAQRLVAIHDGAGNHIRYTLDAAGNRIAEDWVDRTGRLRMKISRTIDLLGRITRITGAAGVLPWLTPDRVTPMAIPPARSTSANLQ